MNRKQRRAKAHEYKAELALMKQRKKRQEEREARAPIVSPLAIEAVKKMEATMKELYEKKFGKIEEQKPSAFVDPVWQNNFGEKLKHITEKKLTI